MIKFFKFKFFKIAYVNKDHAKAQILKVVFRKYVLLRACTLISNTLGGIIFKTN